MRISSLLCDRTEAYLTHFPQRLKHDGQPFDDGDGFHLKTLFTLILARYGLRGSFELSLVIYNGLHNKILFLFISVLCGYKNELIDKIITFDMLQ